MSRQPTKQRIPATLLPLTNDPRQDAEPEELVHSLISEAITAIGEGLLDLAKSPSHGELKDFEIMLGDLQRALVAQKRGEDPRPYLRWMDEL